ncbi:hypothetical protein C8R44DRAFT_893328 [Mycena epipterygia]|nr:hypothetical protein C8R44DRAFT_893328 [Mycena epipterygia]
MTYTTRPRTGAACARIVRAGERRTRRRRLCPQVELPAKRMNSLADRCDCCATDAARRSRRVIEIHSHPPRLALRSHVCLCSALSLLAVRVLSLFASLTLPDAPFILLLEPAPRLFLAIPRPKGKHADMPIAAIHRPSVEPAIQTNSESRGRFFVFPRAREQKPSPRIAREVGFLSLSSSLAGRVEMTAKKRDLDVARGGTPNAGTSRSTRPEPPSCPLTPPRSVFSSFRLHTIHIPIIPPRARMPAQSTLRRTTSRNAPGMLLPRPLLALMLPHCPPFLATSGCPRRPPSPLPLHSALLSASSKRTYTDNGIHRLPPPTS